MEAQYGSMHYQRLLLPELVTELENTRKTLDRVPDGRNDFKPHPKSYSLSQLAGHGAEMPMFVQLALTSPDVDLGAQGYVPLVMDSKAQVVAAFDERAKQLIRFVQNTSDATFTQECELLWDGEVVFAGTRYEAFRSLGLNHLLHHRAQLGVYLRLLEVPVPATPYGPSADEHRS